MGEGLLPQVGPVEDLLAAPVDHLALLVHDLVVLEDVLADLGVAGLDRALGLLDGLGDHLGLDGDVVGQGLAHHPRHGAGGEQAHQLVLERQVEAALAGVALAPRPAPELVVDAPALVALGAEHVETAQVADLVALGRAFGLVLLVELGETGLALLGVEQVALGQGVELGQALGVAPEDDVDAPAGHVGGHGDGVEAARLGHDHALPLVLLGVEHRVLHAPLLEQPGQALGLLDRHRAHQHRLARPRSARRCRRRRR